MLLYVNGCTTKPPRWPEHQHMIVVGAEVGLDGDDAVAARLVFDDDRLPPFGLQLFGEQPCADIGASAGAERHHEPHGSRVGQFWAWAGGGSTTTSRARTAPTRQKFQFMMCLRS